MSANSTVWGTWSPSLPPLEGKSHADSALTTAVDRGARTTVRQPPPNRLARGNQAASLLPMENKAPSQNLKKPGQAEGAVSGESGMCLAWCWRHLLDAQVLHSVTASGPWLQLPAYGDPQRLPWQLSLLSSCHPRGSHGLDSLHLALAPVNCSHCGHVRSEPVDRSSHSLCPSNR